MSDAGWEALDVDPGTAAFPAPATCNGAAIWVVQTPDGYRGVQELCPHDYRSFANARVVGGTMLRCTYHNYTFKLENGKGVNCPGFAITIYNVVERDGKLYALEKTA